MTAFEPLDLTDRTKAAQAKARVLREALPWITRWAGRTVVIKYGGSTNLAHMLTATFAADVALLHSVGLRVVVVHGGGPQISALSARLGLQPRFVDGRRVTDAATLEVVRMVLLGQVNPQLVGMISAAGAPAAGVAGTDAGLIRARQAAPALGAVGEVEAVNPRVLHTLLDDGVVPVVATVGRGPDGAELNINADTVASAVAVALRADNLIYLTNVPGLYEDFGTASSTLLSEVSVSRLRVMLDAGELHTGMIPKVQSIVAAFDGGVSQAALLDGRVEHALLLEIFTDEGIGTMVTAQRAGAPADAPPADGLEEPLAPARSSQVRAPTDREGILVTLTTTLSTAELAAREAAAILPTYRRQPVAFTSGEGPWLVDAEGRRYLDFVSGIAVTALGHAHSAVAEAVAEQARRLVHVSNLYYTEPQVRLAERLKATLGWPDAKAFFCNSGAEANEAAIKLARRHGKAQHERKVNVVALEGGFHGRLLGALLLTGDPAKHAPFAPLGDWVRHVPYDDPDALARAVDHDTCAVWVEVVQGEVGVRPVPDEVLVAARQACDRVGALLVADEVQTGLGRLGAWYGWQTTSIIPDVVCLAKALGNGLPIGAILARGQAATAFGPGDHGSTFGGGPVVCAAALAVLEVIEREGLVERSAAMGRAMADRLTTLAAGRDLVTGVRGRGLLQGLLLARPAAADVTARALDEGLMVNPVAADTVRLAPPLLIGEAELDEMAARLGRALDGVQGRSPGPPHGALGASPRTPHVG